MNNTIRSLVLVALLAAPLPTACGGSDSNSGSHGGESAEGDACVPGNSVQCTCDDGRDGAKQCIDGAFGACTCTNTTEDPLAGTCGNGAIDSGEQCDGANLGVETCESATMNARPIGTLACNAQCGFDVSGCSTGTEAPGTGGAPPIGTGGTMGGGGLMGSGGTLGGGGTSP